MAAAAICTKVQFGVRFRNRQAIHHRVAVSAPLQPASAQVAPGHFRRLRDQWINQGRGSLTPARYAGHDMEQDTQARLERRNLAAFTEEERQGIMLATRVRLVALTVVVAWVAFDSPATGFAYYFYLLEICAFIVLGGLQFLCAYKRIYTLPLTYVFVAVDCLWLAFIFSYQLPSDPSALPPAIAMDTSRFLYFFMFLMQATFSFRPFLVLWCGLCIVFARGGMWLWHLRLPDAYSDLDLAEQSIAAWLEAGTDLNFLFLRFAASEIIVVLLVSAGLAVVVKRSRSLVDNRLLAERRRANLARYFSPNVADRLNQSGSEFATARQQNVAVLFADIVGFTKLCEKADAQEVIELLRGYHDRLGDAVFANNGTLDKYIGDGLMATFGTPDATPQDASNALNCAVDMLRALEAWNSERADAGLAPVQVGIGLHWGPVVVGDIGNDRRLEYTIIGDTVNTASRLEQLTRPLNASLVVSDELMREVDTLLLQPIYGSKSLVDMGEQHIRGRASGVSVWVL
ncbi:MAG: adenylate/guanylate cyclase domain-containing protein [Pseudomonadota bacterium]